MGTVTQALSQPNHLFLKDLGGGKGERSITLGILSRKLLSNPKRGPEGGNPKR